MSWVKSAVRSSLGGKFVVASTGLLLVLFLAAHLAGNFLIFAGPEAMAQYAKQPHSLGPLLWVMRIGMLTVAFLHVTVALRLNLANKAARPSPYAKKTYLNASIASRSMVPSGLFLLAFILFHLADFTLKITRGAYQSIEEGNIYQVVVTGFSDPLHAGFYILAMIALGFHLNHGISSLFQTLGFQHPKYDPLLKWGGPVLGALLAVGFISIPTAVLFGFVR